MTAGPIVLLWSATTWQLGTAARAAAARWTDAAPVGAPGESADAVVAAIAACDARGPITLALASDLCLSASIALDGLPRRDRRQAMIYRLEEQFPIAAEDVACDFVESADHRRALGVATRLASSAELIAALEARGKRVARIVPAAFVTLAAVDAGDADVVLWRDEQTYELFTINKGRPLAWYTLVDLAAVARHLAILAAPLGRPNLAWTGGLDDDATVDVLRPHATLRPIVDWRPRDALLTWTGRRPEIERRGLDVDLRRDGLSASGRATSLGRSMTWAAAGVAALFIAVGVAALYRAAAYERIERSAGGRLESIYAELFPRTPVPIAIRSRLTSEARRLASPRAADAVAARPATARTLFNLLARVPKEAGFSVNEVRIGGDDANVAVEGEARTFGDAQAFATAIRGELPARFAPSVGGGGLRFDVEPPRTTQRPDRSVSFSMTAKPAPLLPPTARADEGKPPESTPAKRGGKR